MSVLDGRPEQPLHEGQRLAAAGAPLASAASAIVMVHGRGATAESMLQLAIEFDQQRTAFLAPQAARNTWYPNSFLAPIESNEPWLSSALEVLESLCQQVAGAGPGLDRTVLMGFSQGACLTLEFAARHARRYGGVVAFTGGLIGPEGTPREYGGSFEATPAFLGSADPDPHVPRWRVEETARVLSGMGADVTTRIYPGMGHTINSDEVVFARNIVAALLES